MKNILLFLMLVATLFASSSVYASHAELWPVTDTRLPQGKSAPLPVLNIQQLTDIFKATETDMYQFLHASQVTDWTKQKEAFSLSDSNFGSVIQFLDSNLYPPETKLFVHDLYKYVDSVYSTYIYKQVSLIAENKIGVLSLSMQAKKSILNALSIHKKMTSLYDLSNSP